MSISAQFKSFSAITFFCRVKPKRESEKSKIWDIIKHSILPFFQLDAPLHKRKRQKQSEIRFSNNNQNQSEEQRNSVSCLCSRVGKFIVTFSFLSILTSFSSIALAAPITGNAPSCTTPVPLDLSVIRNGEQFTAADLGTILGDTVLHSDAGATNSPRGSATGNLTMRYYNSGADEDEYELLFANPVQVVLSQGNGTGWFDHAEKWTITGTGGTFSMTDTGRTSNGDLELGTRVGDGTSTISFIPLNSGSQISESDSNWRVVSTPLTAIRFDFSVGSVIDSDNAGNLKIQICGTDHGDAQGISDASHYVQTGLSIGASNDVEGASQSNATATGDDNLGPESNDEDGVTIPSLTRGASATIPVTVNQPNANDGYLQAWIDWNGNGDFTDSGEQIATNSQSASSGSSTINIPVTVPANATSNQTYARFRWSTTSGLPSSSVNVLDGEVEDYALTIPVTTVTGNAPSCTSPVPLDLSSITNGEQLTAADLGIILGDTVLHADSGNANTPRGNTTGDLTMRYSGFGSNPDDYELQFANPVQVVLSQSNTGNPNFDDAEKWTITGTGGTFSMTDTGLTSNGDLELADRVGDGTSTVSFVPEMDSGHADPSDSNWRIVSTPLTAIRFNFSMGSDTANFNLGSLKIQICGTDHGDAPGISDASHYVQTGLSIGASNDVEGASQSNATATGDDNLGPESNDEDGVTIPSLTRGASATIPVTVNQPNANDGYLQAWIDWNGNGDFTDSGEQIATNLQSASSGSSTINIPVTVPANATSNQTYARFRWSTTSGLPISSVNVLDGEVEDYALTIVAPVIVANNDSPAALGSVAGGTISNVVVNDSIDGASNPTIDTEVTLNRTGTAQDNSTALGLDSTPANGSITMNTDGSITVASNTTAGTYQYTYEICEFADSSNCDTAVVTVLINPSALVATNDSATGVNGASGATDVVNVLTGDTINGVAATTSNATLSVDSGSSVPTGLNFDTADGSVDVAANTPAGTYTFDYQICETLNPTNCDTATVSVTVDASAITAIADSVTGINGASGATDVLNVLTGDTINGAAATTSNATLSVDSGSSVPTGLSFDTADGSVDVAANTPAGTYTFDYQICETLNPTNCETATVNVTVDASTIVATNDSATGVNGASGAVDVVNVLTADTINGAAATTSNATLSVDSGSSVPTGLSFDTADGSVDVAANTLAGTYTFDYQICETLNPTNCDTATVNVTVDASAIVATDDSATGVNGASGAADVVNVLTADTINGAAATTSNATLSVAPSSSVPSGLSFDTADGSVDVAANTPAGNYTFDYQICETLNPTNCDTATVSVTVDASAITAIADSVTGINGASGATDVLNVLTGDTINGAAATTSNATLSVDSGSSVPTGLSFDTADGSVDVAANTPAGTYTFDYQICETLNPTNCETATVSVTVDASAIVATDDSATGVNGASGATDVVNVLTADTINGVAATTSNATLSVDSGSSVPTGLSFDTADGSVDVDPNTPAGTYSFVYQICETLNPTNCETATVSVTVDASTIVATNDSATGVNGASGATDVVNVLTADTINGAVATTSNATLSVASGSSVPTGLSFDTADGSVDVAANTPAGNYTFDYQICETLNPTNCETATVNVTVDASAITAIADSVTGINGASGATDVVNVLTGDTINGVAATTSNATLSVAPSSSVPTGLSFDTADGSVDVAANTPAGTYTFDYQICETLNPTNCDTATVSVTVDASAIVATNDSATGVNGASGATDVVNVLTADTINGVAATTSNATLSVDSGSSVPTGLSFDTADGSVDVAANTPAGNYTFDYQICETLNPTNCDTAMVSVTVDASTIVATDDSATGVNGASGATDVVNVLTADTINGVAATTSNATLSVDSGSSVPTGLSFDTADGSVDVDANTPAGTYSFVYQICETLNPTNCDTATVNVTVDASAIVATDDSATGVNGASGATDVVNVLTADTINGVAATSSNATLSVDSGSSVPTGLSFDTADGSVDVDANTPAGAYSFVYQICETLNPTNCDTATVNVTVDASAIVATDDSATGVNGASGAADVVNVLTADTINGAAADTSNATLSVDSGSSVPTGLSFDTADGSVDVAANTPAGTYTFDYQICETLNPTNCDTATVSVTVDASAIVATDDSATGVNGASGATDVVNVLTADTINGAAATTSNATLSVAPSSSVPTGLSFDTADGSVDVAANTPAGNYTFDYQICETLNPTNCDTATVSVTVDASAIVATDDSATGVNGASGATDVVNVLTADTINGAAATTSNATLSVDSGSSVPTGLSFDTADGSVDVAANTPAGNYTFDYQICETLNPTNCDTATVEVTVDASTLVATDDSATGVNGASGATDVVNVLTGDTINGAAATTSNATLSVAPSSSVPTGLSFDTADGSVDVDANTPAGVYTFVYQICETLNPTNCETATVDVTVDASTIVATNDSATGVNGASGATDVVNVLTADTINGVAATSSNATLSVDSGSSVPTGLSFDTADGSVDVDANTPAGVYTFVYQICETLNPTNCDTATVNVTVDASAIVATDDSATGVNGASGAADVVNVLTADTINGAAADTSNATLSVDSGSSVPTGLSFDTADGSVDVAANTPAGTYTFDYQICETLNPTNCDTATVSVTVDASAIVATDDSATGVNGASGATDVVNVLTADTINGAAATTSNATLSVAPSSSVPTGLSFDTADGSVDVAANTPAGNYTFDYQICETLNPTNCDTATVSVTVDASAIVATDDSATGVNGASGATDVVNVLTADTINGAAATTSNATLSVDSGSSVPTGLSFDTADGSVDVAANTPAGNYTFDYQICETLNPTNCDTATVEVTVDASTLVATDDSATGVNGASGATDVVNVLTGDTINGAAATTSNATLSVAPSSSVPTGLSFDTADGSVDVDANTPAGVYTFVYQICETLNPTNCETATVDVTVDASTIVATNDSAIGVNGASGATDVVNVLTADTINGVAATSSNATLSVDSGSSVPTGLSFDTADGSVDVDANTPAGVYTFVYQICETLNPTNCDTATVEVTVDASTLVATNDSATGVNGASGATDVVNVLTADTINGVAATSSNATLSVDSGSSVPTGLSFDTADGSVDVDANTPAGVYTFVYQICETLNPTNCETATVDVTVDASTIVATNDSATGVNGASGAADVVNVLTADTINGAAADTSNATLSVDSGSSVPTGLSFDTADGSVDVAANTPAGTYTFDYQICETLNPTNCDTATVSVTVDASAIVATDDSATGVNGASGATDVVNVLTADTINGAAATTSNATLSVAPSSSVPTGLSFDTADGSVDVAANTPAGNYTFDYQICETLNPTNCDTATVSVTVDASAIVATDDSATGVNGASGATDVVNVLTADTINGAAATTSNATLSVDSGSSVPTGLSFDTADGSVDVAANTPAGNYTFDYQICETLNPTNCDTATVEVTVDASTLVATDDSATGVNGASGATDVVNVLTGDTINGAAATTSNATLSVAPSSSVPTGLSFDTADGSVDVDANTPAGVYTFVYQICETLNPTNCETATVDVTVDASTIVATNDSATGVNGASGATDVVNVLTADTINGVAATSSNATLSVDSGSSVPTGLSFDTADGSVDVDANTPAGVYTFVYQICETLNPTNCDTATVEVTVDASTLVATNDSATGVNGASGATDVVNVLTADTINGVAATSSNATLSVDSGSSVPTGLSFDTADGSVDVDANTPAGVYTFVYQICETLNPTNCDTATVSVTVAASTLVATDDSATGVNGASGATDVVNVLTADTINGVAATSSNATLSVDSGSSVPTGLSFDTADGSVDVDANTPAGVYTFVYQICETLNPTNCETATVEVTVDASTLVATDDSATGVNGASGATDVVNVLTGDTINGAAATTSNATLSVAPSSSVPTGLSFDTADGSVDVDANTPAGVYTFVYQICETLNPTNCETATVDVTVDASTIVATNDSATGVNGASGATDVVNVLTADTINGVAATSSNATLSVDSGSSVPTGLSFDTADGSVDVDANTPAGVYTFVYQICETLNPTNCETATVDVTVDASTIVATNDSATGVNGASGATDVVNVLTGDTINGAAATTSNATLSVAPSSSVPTGLSFDTADGSVDVDANTPAGTYSFVYQICETLNPTNCDTATVSVTVAASTLVATNDSATGVNGASGATDVVNVLTADTINGVAATSSNATLSVAPSSSVPTGLSFDTADGSVDVAANTPAGNYTFDYQICETLNPTNCETATVEVTVDASTLVATNDSATGVNGASGATDVVNVLTADTINGVAATSSNATLSVDSGSSVPTGLSFDTADGSVDVDANTPAGVYTFVYQICETLNPTNCETATVEVTVDASTLVATDDSATGVNGASGATDVVNVLTGDTINGAAATTSNATLSVAPSSSVPTGLSFDTADGSVDVDANTPAGFYTFVYQICETLNPTNCETATVEVTVDASTLVATDDSATGVNGASGATDVVNVLTGDTINGAAATTSNATLSVAPSSSVPTGLSFDTADGSVDVAANTPAGNYTFDYQICETLNPTNCETATVSVTVDASAITTTADTVTGVNGGTGQTDVVNVLTGDTINGVAATTSNATLSVDPSSSVPAGLSFDISDGSVDVNPSTPAGTYSFDYQICETLNPGNCETQTVTVTVEGVAVSGRVFRDINVNAVNDSSEEGVTQLPVVLYDTVNDTCVSARTDGNGDYVFHDVFPGVYQVYEASRESVPVPKNCGPTYAKNPSGYLSSTDNVTAEFTVSSVDISDQNFGDIKPPVFEPDNTGQVLPGNVVFYRHKLSTPTTGNVSFTSANSGNISASWSSILYEDANCDGELNGSDASAPVSGSLSVAANDAICLINKVYAPANVVANDRYIQKITATFDYGNAIAGTTVLDVQDVTTAQQVQAPTTTATPAVDAAAAVPSQPAQDATPNVPATETTAEVPSTPYTPATDPVPAQPVVDATAVTPEVGPSRLALRKTVKNISKAPYTETATANTAEPGDTLEYRVYYSNTGTGPLTTLVIDDTVPEYTSLVGVADCGIVPAGMGCTASSLGLDDSLRWTFTGSLSGGSEGSVSYRVLIDE